MTTAGEEQSTPIKAQGNDYDKVDADANSIEMMNETKFESNQSKKKLLNGSSTTKVAPETTPKKKKEEKDEDDEENMTPEEKAAKKERLQKANLRAKVIIGGIFREFKWLIVPGVILQIIGMSADVLSPLIIGMVIDALLSANSQDEVRRLIIIWMIITHVSGVINGIQSWILNCATYKVGFKLRQDLFTNIIHKDVEFFDENKTGKLMSRINADCNKLEQALSTQLAMALKNFLQILIVLVIIFVISWRMTLFVLAIIFPLFIYIRIWGYHYRKNQKKISDASAKVSEVAQETFGNIRTVKAFGTEDYQQRVYSETLAGLYKHERTSAFMRGIQEFFMTGLMFGCMDAMIYYSSWLYFNYNFSIGQINAFNSYLFTFMICFAILGSVIGEVFGMIGTMTAIAEIFNYVPKILIEGGDQVTMESMDDGGIKLEDIRFTYPTKKEISVIKNASIHVEKNKTVALVGSSGCGKSTIIQLIERFYDPQEGSVKYGSQNLKDIDPQSYKQNVAIVQQEPVLFSGTIKENIAYGLKDDPSQEDIEFACTQANVHSFVSDKEKFPDGYETLVGERGVKLSGGQKQRIAIARALVRKPKVLLLDEATSALDAESEHQVQQALDQVLSNEQINQTVIVIAHRLSTVKDADQIIVLNKGVICEKGKHDELIAKGGQYAKLVARQLAGAGDAGTENKDQ